MKLFNFTAIEGDWKLLQWLDMQPMQTVVQHELFDLANDPREYIDLAD